MQKVDPLQPATHGNLVLSRCWYVLRCPIIEVGIGFVLVVPEEWPISGMWENGIQRSFGGFIED